MKLQLCTSSPRGGSVLPSPAFALGCPVPCCPAPAFGLWLMASTPPRAFSL
ncbi:hypothetical protein [Lysobacter gummosus]|uniref:hypothetical protein n=1 Tax=Lysobacter gummosus TaxID=262324 RepID=UPI00362F8D87